MATLENAKLLEEREHVSTVELESLKRVFQHIDQSKDNKLDWMEISDVLSKLNHRTPKCDIENMIWEVDDDLDHLVCWDEFLVMYQRCISDTSGLEPRNLYNLVQFLMYDKDFTGEISVEQTLQILFVRYGREKLDSEIQEIFGEEQKLPDGQEKRITYTEYLRRVNTRLAKIRNAKKQVSGGGGFTPRR
jgi:Ca2+-binding EF-hand superfamily protein